MSSHDLFGWDLLHKTVEDKLVRETDVIIALLHWFLVKNSAFRCIGVGDDKTLNENEEASELLPEGWNESERNYALRYVSDGNLYILLAAVTENTLVINLLDVKSRNVSNLALNPTETVKELKGPIKVMIPEVSELLNRFKKELIDPVFSGSTREVTTQTQTTDQSTRIFPGPRLPENPFGIPSPGSSLIFPNQDPLRDVGRGDLDPLGRGGGMIFPGPPRGPPIPFGGPSSGNPFSGLRHPPPPGSRFDPFRPPDPDGRPNPTPDDVRPPDFDDFYM